MHHSADHSPPAAEKSKVRLDDTPAKDNSGDVTRFRPCIDLHNGQVKQIVGGTLSDEESALRTNFVATHPASWFAELYRKDNLTGGHVIMLGPGNKEAAESALRSYPGGLQIGGGITPENAEHWLQGGASHLIVTSWLFEKDGTFSWKKLRELSALTGADKLVVDLSCRRTPQGWTVAMNRWQTLTDLDISHGVLDDLAQYCDEFLIHAADVEGLCRGIDDELVSLLGQWKGRPMTYAGGISRQTDFEAIERLSGGSLDATVGSALDIFGGSLISYQDMVAYNQRTLPSL